MPHSAKKILAVVAQAATVEVADIVSTSHKPAVVRARNIAALLMREEGCTLIEIGRALGKTPTGVVASARRGAAEIDAKLETTVGIARAARRMLAKGAVPDAEPAPPPPASPPRSTMSPPPRPLDPDTERARKLRRQGWTIAGIARYLGRGIGEVETMIGEKQHAFA